MAKVVRLCEVPGCEMRHYSKGLCSRHYFRKRRGASDWMTLPAPLPSDPYERMMLFVERDERGCLLWQRSVDTDGYGMLGIGGRPLKVHRLSYEHAYGVIPKGLVIDHLCRTRHCVEPTHLEAVTNEENLQRGRGYRRQNGRYGACRNGHPYTPENTYTNPNTGKRSCRGCAREQERKRAWQRKQR